MNNTLIYDFETLSNDPQDGVALCIALLQYDELRLTTKPYGYNELVYQCDMIHFDVQDQVKTHGRKIKKDTLDWWSKQNEEAQKLLVPSAKDIPLKYMPSKLASLIKRFAVAIYLL